MYGPRTETSHSRTIHNPETPGRFLASLESAGCKLPAAVKEAWENTEAAFLHIKETIANVKDHEAVHREAVDALAGGTATTSQVLNASLSKVAVTSLDGHTGILERIRSNANLEAANRLQQAIKDQGEDWVTKVMRPAADKLIKELRAADIPEIPVDGRGNAGALEGLAKRKDIAEAWTKLRKIYSTADAFRVQDVIPSELDARDMYEFMGPHEERTAQQATFTVWTAYARQGHTPGLYTQAQVDAHLEEAGVHRVTEAELREQRQREMDAQRAQARTFETTGSSHPGRLR